MERKFVASLTREKSGITKEGLIQFIERNFDELRCGGCADYYSTDYGMSVEDIHACEIAIYNLIANKHRKTKAVRYMMERMEMVKKGEM